MPLGYGYVKREANDYINWAEIGKGVSDTFAAINKEREDKKAAIDKASLEFGQELDKAPQGESKLMNEWALKYASDAQSARLMQDKLLKSGQLKYKDYIVMRQNITDGTKGAFDLVKEYQEEFKTKWDRMKADKSQNLEQFLMAEAEGFGNFNQTQLYINPTSGKVSVAYKEKGPDGVYRMTTDPNKFTDINSLRNRIKGQFDKYDVNANMESYVNGLGIELDSFVETKNSLGATGTIRETLDITNRKNLPKDLQGIVMKFEEAETKALDSQLTNPYSTSSILTNSIGTASNGKPYTFTWDADDAAKNPDKILLKNQSNGSPVPEFSAEQKSAALEYLRLQARLRYDKKSELKVTQQLQLQERRAKTPTEVEEQNDEQLAENFARQTSYLITGTPEQVDAAIKYFRGLGSNIARNPAGKDKGIYIENERGEMVPYKLEGQPTQLGTSVVGSLLKSTGTNLSDTRVIKYFPQFMGKQMNVETSGTGVAQTRDVEGEFNSKIVSKITPSMFLDQKSTVTGPKIKNLLAKVPGVKVDYSGTGSPFNDVIITYKDKKGVEQKVKLNSNMGNDEEATAQYSDLIKLLNSIGADVKEKAIGPEEIKEPKPEVENKNGVGSKYNTTIK